jgi:hypothetical protein
MAKAKLPKPRNGGTMTEAQYFGKLRTTLRRAFRWWTPMRLALEAAKRPSISSNKRLKFEYICCKCNHWFPRKEVEIDHVDPCGSLNTLADVAQFIQKLTPEDIDAFQILCKSCHQEKTNSERKSRICHKQ